MEDKHFQALGEIASKLNDINHILKQIFEQMSEGKNETKVKLAELGQQLLTFNDNILQRSDDISKVHKFTPDMSSVHSNGWRIRKSVAQTWKRSLNERKQSYWNNLKLSNTVNIYEHWLTKPIPVLPRKFRPKLIEGETEEDKLIRRDAAIYAFESEIKIMKNKAARHQGKYLQIDEDIRTLCRQKSEERDVEQWLLNKWEKECEKEAEKSNGFWKEKEEWLKMYALNYGENMFIQEREPVYTTQRETPRPIRQEQSESHSRHPSRSTLKKNTDKEETSRPRSKRQSYAEAVISPPVGIRYESRRGANRQRATVNPDAESAKNKNKCNSDVRESAPNQYFLGQSRTRNKGGGPTPKNKDNDETDLKEIY